MARSTPAQNERGPASSTWRVPHAAAHRSTTGAAARSDRSAARPPETMPASGRSAVSEMARITATGRPLAAATSGADSMSAASMPLAASAARSARRTRWSTVVIGPACARSPARASSPASRGAEAQLTAPTSVPTTRSPGLQVRGQARPDAHNDQLAERTLAQLPGRPRRAGGAIARVEHAGGIGGTAAAQAWPDSARLDPHRRADEQRVRSGHVGDRARVGGVAALARDRLRHALPPKVPT